MADHDDHLRGAFVYGMGAAHFRPGATIYVDRAASDQHPKVPKGIWNEQVVGAFDAVRFGVEYLDGSREAICVVSPGDFRSTEDIETHVSAMYAARGIDVKKMPGWKGNPTAEEQRTKREEMQRRTAEMAEMLRNFHAYINVEELLRAQQFDFGGVAPGRAARPAPSTPERAKAIARCRVFKDMISRASTNEGERSNARDAMARLMAKHGIEDREI